MSRLPLLRRTRLADQVYGELVRSLFAMLLPSIVMTVLFVGVAALAVAVTGDAVLLGLGIAGTGASAVRLWVVVACRRRGVDAKIVDRSSAAHSERVFGVSYVSFALILGSFGARAMTASEIGLHMIVAALVVGYGAGVAAVISLRPRIAGASIVLAVVPPALVSLATLETFHVALAIVLLALLMGGVRSMRIRYADEVEKIEMRHAISGLARRDPLTGLLNRLGFAECFDAAVANHGPHCLIAVHCLDLDQFKPVNDRHGHPVGDELLRLVAGRLAGGLRQGDHAARFGGDEFVVLQCGLRHPDEAELMARRLVRSLGEPYVVGELRLSVGVSIGYAVSPCNEALDAVLPRADNALYAIKALGGGAAGHSDATIGKATVTG